MGDSPLVIGTRGSLLARWQASHIQGLLESEGHSVEIKVFVTKGDRILDQPLAEIGDKGLFTAELDSALQKGGIDLAVHSLKDLPTTIADALTLAAVTPRESPWDAFVPHPSFDGQLEDLPVGAVIGTSSRRRAAHLLNWRPDLQVVSIRGNVDTRLRKLDESNWAGIVLATAGLNRLERGDRIRQEIPLSIMVPAVSQGVLGLVCSQENARARTAVAALNHVPTWRAIQAERAYLQTLEGGCQAPIGAFASENENGELYLVGSLASLDGASLLTDSLSGKSSEANVLGERLGNQILSNGGLEILRAIRDSNLG